MIGELQNFVKAEKLSKESFQAYEIAKEEIVTAKAVIFEQCIKALGNDRKSAVKYLLDAEEMGAGTDGSYVCYYMGLPSSYITEFDEILYEEPKDLV